MAVILPIQPMYAGTDTFIVSSSPTTSHGTDTALTLSTTTRVLLRFPLRKVPHNFSLTDARIGLWMKTGSAGVSVYGMTRPWENSATWNVAKTGTNWTTPGGDYDGATLLASGTLASNAMAYVGSGVANLKTYVNNLLNEFVPNYGFILVVTSGSGTAYAMDDTGQSYVDQSPSTPVVDRTTIYHPVLELTGTYDNTRPASLLVSQVYAMEKRVSKFVLNRPSTLLPQTLGQGVAFLDQGADVTGLVEDWSFSRARTTGAAEIQVEVYDEVDDLDPNKAGKYRNFWTPMDILSLEERLFIPGDQYRYVVQATAVIDGDNEEVERDIPKVPLECRDPGLYGLINTCEIKLVAGQVSYPSTPNGQPVTLEKFPATGPTTTGYYIFRHRLPSGEQTYNWAADPKPTISTIDRGTVLNFWDPATKKKVWDESDQIKIYYGPGEIWIEENFFNAARDKDGMGNPAAVYLTYKRYKTPLDDYMDCMPVNVALYKVMQKAGYQHVEPPGYLYIKSLPPVLADFVFDTVHTVTGLVNVDVSNVAQAETGATLQPSFTFCQGVGDELYFGTTDINHRFNWVYWVPYRLAVGGTFVWEYYNGTGWTAIPPYTSSNWLRGGSDPGVSNFSAGGVVTFDEALLTNWKTGQITIQGGSADTLKRFWMRVRCTAAPTTAPIAHRFAGKEVLQLGQDRKSNTFRDYDEKKHLEVCEEILQSWGVPNYALLIDRYGDVDGRYIVQKAQADYTLSPLAKVKRSRDSKRIFTRVVVKVAEFNNEALLDYAAKINGGQPYHDAFDFQDVAGNTYSTDDYLVAILKDQYHPELTRQQRLFWAIDGSVDTRVGIDYVAAANSKHAFSSELENSPFYRVAFTQQGNPVAIKVAGIECRSNLVTLTMEGFYPTNPDTDPTPDSLTAPTNGAWQVLPGCSQIKMKGGARAMDPVDFTKDADPDRPVISQIRVICPVIYNEGGEPAKRLWVTLYDLKVKGSVIDSVLQGEAVIGTTEPFTTQADQEFVSRYWIRTYPVEKNPFITTNVEATRYAKDQLRELARLFDPMDLEGVHPLVEIGDTVRVQEGILGVDANYVIEEVDRKVGFSYSARLVPYRFGDTTDPPLPPGYPVLAQAQPDACFPTNTGGGSIPTANIAWNFTADFGTTLVGSEVDTWVDTVGLVGALSHTVEVGPQFVANDGDGKPCIWFQPHTTLGNGVEASWSFISQPLHIFTVMKQNTGDWVNGNIICRGIFGMFFQQRGSVPNIGLNGGDASNYISIALPQDGYHVVETILNGATSQIAVDGGAYVTGDTGLPDAGTTHGLNIAAPSNNGTFRLRQSLAYTGIFTGTERTNLVAQLKTAWGIP